MNPKERGITISNEGIVFRVGTGRAGKWLMDHCIRNKKLLSDFYRFS